MSKVITAAKQVWSAKDQITRNIWLAGLGAYDKGYESASNTMTKSHSIFDELVERGRKLEADTTETISTQKDKLASASQNASTALQEKVHSAVSNLTHIDADAFDNIIDKIEQIEIALADAKTEQEKVPAVEIESAVTNKVAVVTAEKTTAVETKVTPVVAKPVVKETVEKVAEVKPHTKKVTNRRVKKSVAKKK